MKTVGTAQNQRIIALDLLRGFSLLGIFIANMLLFQHPLFYIEPYTYFTDSGDATIYRWIAIFVQSSFYPIFAFLFGYGIHMQYAKATAKGTNFGPFIRRRLTILLIFGLGHALLLWAGDVLFTYAVLGFALLLILRLQPKWVLTIALGLYILPNLLLLAGLKLIEVLDDSSMELLTTMEPFVAKALLVYGEGSIWEIFLFRLGEWLNYGLTSTFLGIIIVLPIMMLGVAMSKWQLIERAPQLKGRLGIAALILFPLGLLFKSLPVLLEPSITLIQIQQTFGGVILAAGYVALFLWLTTSHKLTTFLKPLSSAGRMSLTIYLSQTLIATTIFYAYGFGLYGKMDLWMGTLLAIGVFILQLIFAEWWLSKYPMGPMEKLWRSWTYKEKVKRKTGNRQ